MARKKATPTQKAKVAKTMGEYKRGTLHSGSKTGPKVTKRRQAVAIAMKQSGQDKARAARRKRLENEPM